MIFWLRYHATATSRRTGSDSALRCAGSSDHILELPPPRLVHHLQHEHDGERGACRIESVSDRQPDISRQDGKAHADQEIGRPLRSAAHSQAGTADLVGEHLAEHYPHDPSSN